MRVYRYKCIPLWNLLYVSDCARSQRHSRLFLPNWDTQLHTYSETHTERWGEGVKRWRQRWQNQDFLCGLEQCSVYVHCTHDTRTPVSIENTVKENVGAIYCCHQITNFFTQYAPACYICAVIVALLSRAAPRYDTDRPIDQPNEQTNQPNRALEVIRTPYTNSCAYVFNWHTIKRTVGIPCWYGAPCSIFRKSFRWKSGWTALQRRRACICVRAHSLKRISVGVCVLWQTTHSYVCESVFTYLKKCTVFVHLSRLFQLDG